jgi:hypothetical protein
MNYSTGSTVNFASLVGQLDLSLKSIDFNFFMIMIIFPIGLFLNGLQLFVFSKRELNLKTNMGSMHALLSFFNILAIIFSILLTQLLPFLGINIKTYTNFGCKILSFIQRVSLDIPSFQQVMITFQFYMSIKFPMKFIAFQNSKKQYLFIILGMVVFAIAENIGYFFFELTLTYSNLTRVNASANETSIGYTNVCYASFYLILGSGIASLIFRNFLPFIIMLIFNILIIYHIIQNHLKVNKSYKARGHKHFFISIMTINLIFFILYLPWSIGQIIVFVQYFFTARTLTETVDKAVIFFYTVGWSISYLNYIFPFFVYIQFNRLFRKQLFLMVNYVSKEKSSSNFDPRTFTKTPTRTTTKVMPEKRQSKSSKQVVKTIA